MDAEELRQKAQNHDLKGYTYNSVQSAYRIALLESNPEDVIIVAGSTFVVSEVI